MKIGYELRVFHRGPYGHGGWLDLDVVYLRRKQVF
jgi:hypothetical protein